MKSKSFWMLTVPVLLLISACTPINNQNSRQNYGVGSGLYNADMKRATANLSAYLGFLCQQAGYSSNNCADKSSAKPNWTILVRTGFNDIDRRCDEYLSWLQAVRNRDKFVNSQFTQIARLTNTILTAVNPAAGTTIGIVAEAFGYARTTFNDYQQRILLGYEDSTIQTIVSKRRLDYREKFGRQEISNRPDTVFVLRSYLRICMPFTIAMNANTFARATATGTANNLISSKEAETVRNSLLGKSLRDSIPETPKAQVKPTPRSTKFVLKGIRLTRIEKTLSKSEARTIQRALCVNSSVPFFGNKTRSAISEAKVALFKTLSGYSSVFPESRNSVKFDTLNVEKQIDFFTTGQGGDDCIGSTYQNAYEKFRYPNTAGILRFQAALATCETNLGQSQSMVTQSGDFDSNTRAAIKSVKNGLFSKGIYSGTTSSSGVTSDFISALSRCRTLQ